MAKYLKYTDAERQTSRINLDVPNFEYLMMKASQHCKDTHTQPYEIVKKTAIYLLGCQMLRSVQILQDGFGCDQGNDVTHKLPNKIFSWLESGPEKFERRRTQNLFWMDIMEKTITDDCLELKKLYIDMEVLQHCIRKLFQAYICGQPDIVNKELEEMCEYLFKLEAMQEEHEMCEGKLHTVSEAFFEANFPKRNTAEIMRPLKTELEEYMMVSGVEQRCAKSFCESKIEEAEMAGNRKIHLLQKQIDEYNFKIQREQAAHMHSVSMYHNLCDVYRYDLYRMHTNYDKNYNLYDTKIIQNLAYINWMKDQQQFYVDTLKSYHRRLSDLQREDMARAQREEARRQLEQNELQLKHLKKAAKKSPRFSPGIRNKRKNLQKNIKI